MPLVVVVYSSSRNVFHRDLVSHVPIQQEEEIYYFLTPQYQYPALECQVKTLGHQGPKDIPHSICHPEVTVVPEAWVIRLM